MFHIHTYTLPTVGVSAVFVVGVVAVAVLCCACSYLKTIPLIPKAIFIKKNYMDLYEPYLSSSGASVCVCVCLFVRVKECLPDINAKAQ